MQLLLTCMDTLSVVQIFWTQTWQQNQYRGILWMRSLIYWHHYDWTMAYDPSTYADLNRLYGIMDESWINLYSREYNDNIKLQFWTYVWQWIETKLTFLYQDCIMGKMKIFPKVLWMFWGWKKYSTETLVYPIGVWWCRLSTVSLLT